MADHQQTELPPDALIAAQSGRKLDAIRIVREETGVSLTEAKRMVDASTRDFTSEPPRTSLGQEDRGALRLVAVLVALSAAAAALYFL